MLVSMGQLVSKCIDVFAQSQASLVSLLQGHACMHSNPLGAFASCARGGKLSGLHSCTPPAARLNIIYTSMLQFVRRGQKTPGRWEALGGPLNELWPVGGLHECPSIVKASRLPGHLAPRTAPTCTASKNW